MTKVRRSHRKSTCSDTIVLVTMLNVIILFLFLFSSCFWFFLRCEIKEVKNSIWFRMFTLENNCLLLFSSKKLTYFLKMYLELLRRTSSAFYDQNTKKSLCRQVRQCSDRVYPLSVFHSPAPWILTLLMPSWFKTTGK